MFSGLMLKNEEKAVFTLRSLYRRYGYTQYKMSKFEEYDLYVRNKDFLVSDSIITFTDTNGKLLALKPDVTLSIVKNSKDTAESVQKVYYNENVYRISKNTHEFKEIMQTGLECIGSIDDYNVYEVIMLAAKSLEAISENYVLDISHTGFAAAILDSIDCPENEKEKILKCIGEKNQSEIEKICKDNEIGNELSEKLLTLVSTYGSIDDAIVRLKKICDTDKLKNVYDEFSSVCRLLTDNGLDKKINIDFSIANDMSYYNGVAFQGFIENIPVSVLSGGRYDNLMKKMGRKSGAIGFAVYLDLLERLNVTEEKYDVDALLIYDSSCNADDVSKAVEMLASAGKSVMAQRSVPESIKYRQLLKLNGKGVEILENND